MGFGSVHRRSPVLDKPTEDGIVAGRRTVAAAMQEASCTGPRCETHSEFFRGGGTTRRMVT